MTVKRYRKKPVVIEAMHLRRGLTTEDVQHFCPTVEEIGHSPFGSERVWVIKTLEGTMQAATGDYIIKGVAGEFYPCRPDIFEQTYEAMQAREQGCPTPTSG